MLYFKCLVLQLEVPECFCQQTGNAASSYPLRRNPQHFTRTVFNQQPPHRQMCAAVNGPSAPKDPAYGLQSSTEFSCKVREDILAYPNFYPTWE